MTCKTLIHLGLTFYIWDHLEIPSYLVLYGKFFYCLTLFSWISPFPTDKALNSDIDHWSIHGFTYWISHSSLNAYCFYMHIVACSLSPTCNNMNESLQYAGLMMGIGHEPGVMTNQILSIWGPRGERNKHPGLKAVKWFAQPHLVRNAVELGLRTNSSNSKCQVFH